MNKRMFALVLCLPLVFGAGELVAEDLRVLSETIDGVKPTEMMDRYLRGLARAQFEAWQQQYEQRKTREQITEYRKRLRREFVEAIGGLPERTPLNPQVTGVVARDGYKVEQNIFGQLAFGMDHADYIMMRVPKPTLICAATGDFFDISGTWTSFRYAKLTSWSNVIEQGRSVNQQVNAVHGALKTYDLPNLAATLGDKLIIKEPLDALGQPVEAR